MTGPSPGAERPLVLIVDDDERNLKLAGDVLRAAGFETLAAATGAEALALAAERPPDVVLLDLRLPDVDGTEVARVLRDRSPTAHVPVVALTAVRVGGDEQWLLEAGFTGSIEKPIDIRRFPDEVRRYCGTAK